MSFLLGQLKPEELKKVVQKCGKVIRLVFWYPPYFGTLHISFIFYEPISHIIVNLEGVYFMHDDFFKMTGKSIQKYGGGETQKYQSKATNTPDSYQTETTHF